jgi:hypothetical protein
MMNCFGNTKDLTPDDVAYLAETLRAWAEREGVELTKVTLGGKVFDFTTEIRCFPGNVQGQLPTQGWFAGPQSQTKKETK